MRSSKLLVNEPPLLVLPTLARLLGIEQAIILQQVQYWISTSKHEAEGEVWIYNSYRQWAEQFPWLSARAVRHHIGLLTTAGILVVGIFNKDARDHTRWYRIDYEALDAILSATVDGVTDSSQGVTKEVPPSDESCHVDVTETVSALPETTTENTPENTIDDDRPNEFTEYESNIGMLTPVIADKLKEAIDHYPKGWVSDAIKVAAENNARSWRYIEKVLENWQAHGKNAGQPGNRPVPFKGDKSDSRSNDPDKYVKGKYGHMVSR